MLRGVTTWLERSPAVAAMLNPALLAVVAATAAEEYRRRSGNPLPYAYPYLVAPLVLHRDTREALPRRIDSHLATWLLRNPVLAAGFPQRAKSLAPAVTDGLRFGFAHDTFTLTEDGDLIGSIADSARPAQVGDIASIVARSGFVGRWLTKIDRPATAFALLGVRP
jgi:hypothetical protein